MIHLWRKGGPGGEVPPHKCLLLDTWASGHSGPAVLYLVPGLLSPLWSHLPAPPCACLQRHTPATRPLTPPRHSSSVTALGDDGTLPPLCASLGWTVSEEWAPPASTSPGVSVLRPVRVQGWALGRGLRAPLRPAPPQPQKTVVESRLEGLGPR